MNYEEFGKLKCEELLKVQNIFRENFKIDSYANWFYDSETELLRLYNDDEDEIFFRYIPVGTFSLKSRTWMWSWFNESSIEKSKTELLVVKEFGNENNYEKLKEGTFASDEYDGWELASICLDFLNGIGVYKVDTDNLEKYMLIMGIENHDSPKVRKLKQKVVECGKHGHSRPAFVCDHLDLETPKGFEEAFDTYKGMELEEEDDFQAWCNECEKIRLEHDGWNEESEKFAQIQLICEDCYFELKEFNQIK
ncbi:DUF6882 domain-containing protein [Chryseobacterium populi]|uniref:Uncharacterized protein n=1 Tax=Chryseobacterium populi TaxID=1144316 RepID=J2KMS4_9FLAO|nr:DUF6882 domain-containing protein [Chryseobacterium populi]EJL74393.1 hypothetical protein PMI13_01132 [Chryseobacterium populi]